MNAFPHSIRRPATAGLAAVIAIAAAITVAPLDRAAADRGENAAAAATGFAAGAIVGATVAQPRGYVAPRGYVRSGYATTCRTKTVRVVDRYTGRTVVKKTRTCR